MSGLIDVAVLEGYAENLLGWISTELFTSAALWQLGIIVLSLVVAIFITPPFRRCEVVYLHELTDGFHAERVIGEWIGFYNTERPHSSLDGQTPAEAYGAGQPVDMMDKARALPTSPQAQQQQQDVIKRILAA